jgi:MFS family permease
MSLLPTKGVAEGQHPHYGSFSSEENHNVIELDTFQSATTPSPAAFTPQQQPSNADIENGEHINNSTLKKSTKHTLIEDEESDEECNETTDLLGKKEKEKEQEKKDNEAGHPFADPIGQPQDNRSWWQRLTTYWNAEILAVLFVLLLTEASRGIILPTLSTFVEYLNGDSLILSLAVSLFSVGRFVGAPFLGWWYNKRGAMEVLAVALGIGVLANLAYTFAYISDKYVLLISRLVIGFSTGLLGVCRAHIAAKTTLEDRTQFMGYAGAVQFVGFSLVPGVNPIFSTIDTKFGGLTLNMITMPGVFLAFLNALAILLCWLAFSPSFTETVASPEAPKKKAYNPIEESAHQKKLMIVGAAVFIMLNFVARGILALVETFGTVIFLRVWNDQEGDGLSDTSLFYLYLGVLGMVVYLTVGYIQKIITETWLLLLGFGLIGFGLVVIGINTAGISVFRFSLGCGLLLSLGSPIVQTVIISSFSTILGSQPQGTLMGIITCAGSLGRIFFPLLGAVSSESVAFLWGALLSFVSAAFTLGYYYWVAWEKKRAPPEERLC